MQTPRLEDLRPRLPNVHLCSITILFQAIEAETEVRVVKAAVLARKVACNSATSFRMVGPCILSQLSIESDYVSLMATDKEIRLRDEDWKPSPGLLQLLWEVSPRVDFPEQFCPTPHL